MQNSITTTAAVALGGAGAGNVVIWLIACINADQIVTPSQEVATLLAAALLPLGHALCRAVLAVLAKLSGNKGATET